MDSRFGVFDAGFHFFWGAPGFVLAVVRIERIAMHGLLRSTARAGALWAGRNVTG